MSDRSHKHVFVGDVERVVEELGKGLSPVRKAFIYLAYEKDDEKEYANTYEFYMDLVEKAIREAEVMALRLKGTEEGEEWGLRLVALRELRERLKRLSLRRGVRLISLGRSLKEADFDERFDRLLMAIVWELLTNGIPHDIVDEGFLVVLEEDYEDAVKVVEGVLHRLRQSSSSGGRSFPDEP